MGQHTLTRDPSAFGDPFNPWPIVYSDIASTTVQQVIGMVVLPVKSEECNPRRIDIIVLIIIRTVHRGYWYERQHTKFVVGLFMDEASCIDALPNLCTG
jgi:hypothetical protein